MPERQSLLLEEIMQRTFKRSDIVFIRPVRQLRVIYRESSSTTIEDFSEVVTSACSTILRRFAVETFFGFHYKYRDPVGARVEFQSFVGILDPVGSRELHDLEPHAQDYIETLPWVRNAKSGGSNGPFEMDIFQSPDFNGMKGRAIILLAWEAGLIY